LQSNGRDKEIAMKLLVLATMVSGLGMSMIAQAPRVIPVNVVTDFGGAADDPASELVRVTDVVQTDDGRFVVTNGRPLEVRVYDRNGRLERRLGRAGDGPGEFQRSAMLRHWPGDSVLTFSSSTRRWMLFRLNGTLVREWPLPEGEPSPGAVILLGGAFVRSQFAATAHCRAAVIRRLAPATGPLHEALVDPAGRVWLRATGGDAWRVSSPEGHLLGSVGMPGLLVTQMRADGLVGYRLDDDDFPHVIAMRVALPAATRPLNGCPATAVQSERAPEVKATMRNAMTAAEAFYSRGRRYPRDMGEVGGMLELPRGIAGRFEATNNGNGFAFSAWEEATGYRCVVSVGEAIPGYPDGVLGCGG
jgi:hypothetical protein